LKTPDIVSQSEISSVFKRNKKNKQITKQTKKLIDRIIQTKLTLEKEKTSKNEFF